MIVALVIHLEKCMHYIKLSYVASLTLHHFSTFSHKWLDIQKTVMEHKMCVLTSSTTFVRKISQSKMSS